MGFSIREKRAMGFNLKEGGSTVYFSKEQRANVDIRKARPWFMEPPYAMIPVIKFRFVLDKTNNHNKIKQ